MFKKGKQTLPESVLSVSFASQTPPGSASFIPLALMLCAWHSSIPLYSRRHYCKSRSLLLLLLTSAYISLQIAGSRTAPAHLRPSECWTPDYRTLELNLRSMASCRFKAWTLDSLPDKDSGSESKLHHSVSLTQQHHCVSFALECGSG